MAQDLSGLYISQSFQNLVQRSASGAFNVLATATGVEFIPISASYAISASKAQSVVSASYAVSSSYALSSSRAVSASRADSAVSASYALSSSYAITASYAENAAINTLQQVLTAGNVASLGMTLTGSVAISGSQQNNGWIVTGAGSNTNNDPNDITNAIIGGENNTLASTATYSGIFGASRGTVQNSDATSLIGGFFNTAEGVYNAIVGGNRNTIDNGTATHIGNVIVGGQYNKIPTAISRSVVLGGTQVTASRSNTVFTPALDVKNEAIITGSVIGATSILAGQNAPAFSSDKIELGSSTVPVQYGNVIIHGSNTRDLGNKYNSFQIVSAGSNTVQLANTAFSGIGNDVHLLGMGANSVGRADNIKLWSSGSGAQLNLSTDVIIQSGNKLTMSGSIELASSTGSVGQVIGVDASGKAKWETAAAGGGSALSGSNYIVVSGSGTDAQNATELSAALAIGVARSPNGSAKSATNRFTVIVAPGNYDYTATDLDWNTDFVDFRSLTGEKDVYFSNATYTFQLSANDAKITGIDTGTKAFKVATNLANVIVSNCKGGNNSFGTSETISGTYINCESGGTSFAGNGGTASGTFINCKTDATGNLAFGALFGASTGVFEDCFAYINFAGYVTAQGSYKRCEGFGEFLRNGVGSSGRAYYCFAPGGNNFGKAVAVDISGQVLNCITGTDRSGNADSVYPGVAVGGKLVNSIDGLFTVNNIVR